MRGKGLAALIIFADLLAVLALAGTVWLVFFTSKLEVSLGDVLDRVEVPRESTIRANTGFSEADLKALEDVFGADKTTGNTPVDESEQPDQPEQTVQVEDIMVIGVIYDPADPADSMAIILDKSSGEQQNIFVGDTYKGWTFEKAIDRVTILLAKGDVKKKIRKAEKEDITSSENPNGSNKPAPAATPRNIARTPSGARPSPRQRRSMPRAYFKQQAKSQGAYDSRATVEVFYEKGRPAGIEIVNLEGASILKYFGLQPGDIVRSWNGRTMTTPNLFDATVKRYWTNVDAMPKDNVIEVVRRGHEVTLELVLR
ncbi:MAG: hypothetical protein U5N86_10020 [Planctomycetota bacterium]|nr:hypothetical protein [Planctomycetota bacterium]